MKLCFATNNLHKLEEIKNMLGSRFEILSLADIGCTEELPENQDTLEGNSEEKARYIANRYAINCFADDTGLEVEALNGKPGVVSARYAGPQRNNLDNMALLLEELKEKESRSARFRTVITLVINERTIQFEGIAKGSIALAAKGNKGFGYDPVFIPEGLNKTFAELSMKEKNKISHRGIAFNSLVSYLQQNIM